MVELFYNQHIFLNCLHVRQRKNFTLPWLPEFVPHKRPGTGGTRVPVEPPAFILALSTKHLPVLPGGGSAAVLGAFKTKLFKSNLKVLIRLNAQFCKNNINFKRIGLGSKIYPVRIAT